MSLPKAIFLDTSVFAGQQYNYSSAMLTSFIPVARDAGLTILLPDPTQREVQRQIKERATAALKALGDARRKAPFLAKWEHFPPKQEPWDNWKVWQVARAEWQEFLSNFHVEELGYDGVSIPEVMSWYDLMRAPFGEGKKRKEFPDAFAIQIVSLYADKHDTCVAVVSDDGDIQRSCEHYPSLLYFPSLSRLTELLLVGGNELEQLREALEKGEEILADAIYDEVAAFGTYVYDERYQEEDTSIGGPEITDVRIVGLGNDECTVIFEAEYESEHKLRWEEVIDPVEGYTHEFSDWVEQINYISGTAKLVIEKEAREITSVTMVVLDQSEIEVERMPYR